MQVYYLSFAYLLLSILSANDMNAQARFCEAEADNQALVYMEQNREAIARFSQTKMSSRSNEIIMIQPHIITRSDGTGGLSQVALDREVAQLNMFFSNMKVVFETCETNYISEDNFYDLDVIYEDLLIQNDRPNVINVYYPSSILVNNDSVCGYAYFPGSSRSIVVVAAACATNGVTLAHEIGHYFSLFHTHGKTNNGTTDELVDGSNCAFAGDDLCDTPADPNLLGKVSTSCEYIGLDTDANGHSFIPQPGNMMSYSLDQCMKFFTEDQFNRMRYSLENDRRQLLDENPLCEKFNLDNCQFDVSNLNDVGKGSLRYAMRCANLNPGPDTIRFKLPSTDNRTINILSALPTLTDDGTYIDGLLEDGSKVMIDAEQLALFSIANGDPALLFINGNEIELANLEFRNFIRGDVQAAKTVAVMGISDLANSYVIRDNVFYNNLTAIISGKSLGEITNNLFKQNVMGIIAGDRSEGIYFRKNSFNCNSRGPFDFAIQFTQRYTPDAPQINGGNNQRITGVSVPDAIVDFYERNINDCSFSPCQGTYIGSVQADHTGNWAFEYEFLVLNYYTATGSVWHGDRWLTSQFAECFRIVAEEKVWVYPNPGDGLFTLELNGKTASKLEIFLFDVYGKQIALPMLEKADTYAKTSLDLRMLGKGYYFLQIEIGNESVVKKLAIR